MLMFEMPEIHWFSRSIVLKLEVSANSPLTKLPDAPVSEKHKASFEPMFKSWNTYAQSSEERGGGCRQSSMCVIHRDFSLWIHG